MLQALPNIQPEKPSLHWLGLTTDQLEELRQTLENDLDMFGEAELPLSFVSVYNKVLRLCGVLPDARH